MPSQPRSGTRREAVRSSSRRARAYIATRGSWIAVLAGGEAFYQVIRRVALHTDNPHLLPGMVLTGALIVPVTFVTFLHGRGTRHDVTLATGLVTGLAGACVALSLSAGLEQLAMDRSLLTTPVVSVVEEATKLLVAAVVLVWFVPPTPRNGLIVGAACGAGFAVMETLGYSFVDYLRPDGGLVALDNDLLERSLFAPATHLAWTALTACALGYAASGRRRLRALLTLIVTFTAVALLHALWDASNSLLAYVALTAVALALLAGALRQTAKPASCGDASSAAL